MPAVFALATTPASSVRPRHSVNQMKSQVFTGPSSAFCFFSSSVLAGRYSFRATIRLLLKLCYHRRKPMPVRGNPQSSGHSTLRIEIPPTMIAVKSRSYSLRSVPPSGPRPVPGGCYPVRLNAKLSGRSGEILAKAPYILFDEGAFKEQA